MRKYWDKIVAILSQIPVDKWMHFCAGLIVAAFFAIVCHAGGFAILFAFLAGFVKEFCDSWKDDDKWNWLDLIATTCGGLIIEIFWCIAYALW